MGLSICRKRELYQNICMLQYIFNNKRTVLRIENIGTPSFKGALAAQCSICDKNSNFDTGPIYISRIDQKQIKVSVQNENTY